MFITISDPINSGRILDRRFKPWSCCQISKRFSVHGNWKYNEIQTKTTTYPKIQLVFTSVISKNRKTNYINVDISEEAVGLRLGTTDLPDLDIH